MSDTVGPESDPGYSPSTPSTQRSATPDQETDLPSDQNDKITSVVERQLGEALMLRAPPMPGSLLFLRTYTHLLAETQTEVDFATSRHEEDIFQVSQLGSVVWTSTEKEAFFNTLNRKGKGSVKELAAAVGTKSELEVLEYLRRLQQALEIQHVSDPYLKCMPVLGDVPAATEISQEGCELLNDYADVLVLKESLVEEHSGKRQHGTHWNLTSAAALDLMNVVDGEDDGTVRADLRLAANLLHVPDWIQLSRGLFMNFGGAKVEDNWQNIVKSKQNITAQNQTPSMTADSVVDFYSLAVSITRRLVQSSIFFAMSRLRGANRSGRDRKDHVRISDVRAAIEVLNMKHRRPNFVHAARRNEVAIADIHHRKDWVPTSFTYDEAEEIIGKSGWTRYRNETATSAGVSSKSDARDGDGSESYDSNDEDVERAADEQEAEVISVSSSPSRESETSSPLSSSDELEMDSEETHAEIADQAISRREEAMFLRLMDQTVPSILDEHMKEEEMDGEFNPPPERRDRDVRDWRDRVHYHSEWEELGYDFADLKDELEMPPQKRPRFNEPEPPMDL
jgi:RNA polymerase I-specific transcription initiation factor RRN5